jgi:hypothetical protein
VVAAAGLTRGQDEQLNDVTILVVLRQRPTGTELDVIWVSSYG